MDWDQFTFWNAVPRDTILRYHQFPLWNPYVNGGNVLLAHPDSPFLSPFYLFVLIFGPVIGLKIQILLHVFIGLLGMFILCRHLKQTIAASYFSSFVYMLSSVYPLHITEGQMEWIALAYVPWCFFFYRKSFENSKYILGAIFFLGLMIFTGVYVFNIFIVFLVMYCLTTSLKDKSFFPIKLSGLIFLGTFLFCAVKLFPMLEFLSQNPRIIFNKNEGTNIFTFFEMILSRNQYINDINIWDATIKNGKITYGWHEYGAYVGVIPLSFYFITIFRSFKKQWPLIIISLFFLLIVLGKNSPINLWGALHSFPIYRSLTVPSRFVSVFIFILAILGGYGLTYLEGFIDKRNFKHRKTLIYLIVLIVLSDLNFVNSKIFKNAFRIKPVNLERRDQFVQRYRKFNLSKEEDSRSSIYPIFLRNEGILDGYECVGLNKGAVNIVDDEDYKGELYLYESKGEVVVEMFSPNSIEANIKVEDMDFLVLNQNFENGWKINVNGNIFSASFIDGLVAVPLKEGIYKINIFYRPNSFVLGAILSVVFVLYFFILIFLKTNENIIS